MRLIEWEGRIGRMARHFATRLCPAEDLAQEGRLALLEAMARYDPTRGAAFSTYARVRISSAMRHYRRDRGGFATYAGRRAGFEVLTERVVEDGEEVSLYDLRPDPSSIGWEKRAQDRVMLERAMARLSERERRAIRLYYYEGRTAREVAAEWGVSEAMGLWIIRKTLKRLSRHLRSACCA